MQPKENKTMKGLFILTKESPHGIKLYAQVGRDSTVVWRVEKEKATQMTAIRATLIAARYRYEATVTVEEV